MSDEGIVLGASRGAPLAMTPLELVDAALAAQESALGILTGLNCALFTIETDLSGGRLGAAVLGAFPSSLMVRTALALMGWTDTSVVTQEDGRVLVSGVGSFGPSPGALAAALAAVLPPEFTSLAVIGQTGGEVHTLDADLGAMRNFSQDVGAVSGANVVLAATRCAVDGEPLMTGAMVERWFEAQVRTATGLPFVDAIAALRSLMRLADALGRYDLRDRPSEAIRRLRS